MAQGFWNQVGNMFLRGIGLQKPGTIDSFNGLGSTKSKSGGQYPVQVKKYDVDSLYKSLGGGSSSSSGGGGYSVKKADISGLLKAYENEAASNRAAAKSTYNTTRNDLLTSLKRFQEQNAKDVKNQKQSYLSEQSSLESARESANRQSRISAAARGLGGSGLQQLAQLQNMIGQSEEISQAANENQSAMDKLAEALAQKQEDTDTSLANALQTYNDAIRSINSNLKTQRENAIAQNERDYANAVNQARAQAAAASSSSSSTNAAARAAAEQIINNLTGMQTTLTNSLKGVSNSSKKGKKTAKEAKENALATLAAINEQYGLTSSIYNTANNNINNILKNYGF